jgi:RNA polymerase sigma-70 factor, ECF subfamily
MLVQDDSRVFGELVSTGREGFDEVPAGLLGESLETFRAYLNLIAQRELGPDLAAKVSASDIVQETFLAAGRDLGQFQGAGPEELRRWLRGILQNVLANTRRHYRGTSKRRVHRETRAARDRTEYAKDSIEMVTASISSPSGRAMRHERAEALRAVIDRLPEHYRQIIRWHHQEHLPFEAIAARLAVSPEAARKVWGRALLRLRAALGPGHDPR